MKQPVLHTYISFLLLGIICGLSACSNEVLIDRGRHHDTPDPDGKVTLAMTVNVAPRSGTDVTDPGEPEESVIHSLYVFVFNLGASSYCEAQSFTSRDLSTNSGGNQTFEMKVTPGRKRFYLVANPGITFRSDLTSYTQEELQGLTMKKLKDHSDEEDMHVDDEIQKAVNNKEGLPMSMSITGTIELTGTKPGDDDHVYVGQLTLDGNTSDIFNMVRAVAKVNIICSVSPDVSNGTLNMAKLEIVQANRAAYLFPKYILSGADWITDWSSMAAGADLTRKVGYEYGKQEGGGSDWRNYPRGTHYLYENYNGPALAGEREGLNDETKFSHIHIVLSDGRDKTFPLTYLKRNDYLTVTIKISPSKITCDIHPWSEDIIYPDYTTETKGGG